VRLTFADPLALLTLHQTDGRTNLLANPQIRVRNKEKAKIHIGDRVPVLTTTAAAAGSFVSQSVTYLDVGLKLEVEPLVYLDDDVGIKLSLEVSSITNTIQTPSGTGTTLVYQVGTRNTSTVLRLHDGETQVLAGLITDEDRRSAIRIPGLGEVPALGRLFSSTSDNTVKTEIVLLITPRLIRTMQRADARNRGVRRGHRGFVERWSPGRRVGAVVYTAAAPACPAAGARLCPERPGPDHGQHARTLRRSAAGAVARVP